MSYALGNWFIDANSSVKIFEDNDNFFNGNKLEQDPPYQAQLHRVYNLKKGRWLSVNAHHSIKLAASRGVVTRVGNEFDTYGIFWQYRF